jgi:hypothetical protein
VHILVDIAKETAIYRKPPNHSFTAERSLIDQHLFMFLRKYKEKFFVGTKF